jgi:TRAP-type C4-dicarboxylate transport system permease small subunit
VIFLTCQVISIIVMVFGRYLFSYVPRATEEFSLFCMVWFSLLSISLSIRDDSHIKMEIMDALVARDKLKYFQYFAAILTLGFSVYMVVYGYKLVELTARTQMSGFQISEGWLYLSIPVSGVCMALSGVVFFTEKIREYRHDN